MWEILNEQERILNDGMGFRERLEKDLHPADKALSGLRPNLACYGSARIQSDHPYYQRAMAIAHGLSDAGFNIITGGGPGLMEALNKGAHAGRSKSIGLQIQLPHEQRTNDYLDVALNFHYFFTRKITFAKYAVGFVALPGGFGTLDELSEMLTLIQTKRMMRRPIVFFEKAFWAPLIAWFTDRLLKDGLIAPEDLQLFRVFDEVDEAIAYFKGLWDGTSVY